MQSAIVLVVLLLSSSSLGNAWISSGSSTRIEPQTRRLLAVGESSQQQKSMIFEEEALYGEEEAKENEPFFLSDNDMKRIEQFKATNATIPIMILDAMLPGQVLEFTSADNKFKDLIDFATNTSTHIGMLGFHPRLKIPLNRGVTVGIQNTYNEKDDSYTVRLKGGRLIEIQSPPNMHVSNSFYMAHVKYLDRPIMDEMQQELEPQLYQWNSTNDQIKAKELYEMIPNLVKEWQSWVIKSGKTDANGLKDRMDDIGPMPQCRRDLLPPKAVTERSMWVAAMINPLPALGVALEVRPAMLYSENALERIQLAVSATQSSIQHLSGEKKLF